MGWGEHGRVRTPSLTTFHEFGGERGKAGPMPWRPAPWPPCGGAWLSRGKEHTQGRRGGRDRGPRGGGTRTHLMSRGRLRTSRDTRLAANEFLDDIAAWWYPVVSGDVGGKLVRWGGPAASLSLGPLLATYASVDLLASRSREHFSRLYTQSHSSMAPVLGHSVRCINRPWLYRQKGWRLGSRARPHTSTAHSFWSVGKGSCMSGIAGGSATHMPGCAIAHWPAHHHTATRS